MIPINNSDTAWLIVADYNQEHNLPYLDLIEDVNNPEVNHWDFEHRTFGVGAKDIDAESNHGAKVGGPITPQVGGGFAGILTVNGRVGNFIYDDINYQTHY